MLYCILTPFLIVNRIGGRGPMKVWIQTQKEEFKMECFALKSKKKKVSRGMGSFKPNLREEWVRHCGVSTLTDEHFCATLHCSSLLLPPLSGVLSSEFLWRFLILAFICLSYSLVSSSSCPLPALASHPLPGCIKFGTAPVSLLKGERLFLKTHLLWRVEFAKVPIQFEGQIVGFLPVLNAYSSNCPKQSQGNEKFHNELKAVYFLFLLCPK